MLGGGYSCIHVGLPDLLSVLKVHKVSKFLVIQPYPGSLLELNMPIGAAQNVLLYYACVEKIR